MRRSIILFVLFLVPLMLQFMVGPVKADIEELTWLPPYAYKGYDSLFYLSNVVGYETGSTAGLAVPVNNNVHSDMDVSLLWISFDWGGDVTLDLRGSPVRIPLGSRHVFTLSFIVPSRTVASDQFAHTYTVFVQFNATGVIGDETWWWDWNYSNPCYKFAVLSRTQMDALRLRSDFWSYPASPPVWMTSPEANRLWYEAQSIALTADTYYRNADFTNAKTRMELAISMIDDAFETEKDFRLSKQEAEMATANAVLIGALGCLIGGILIGIGIMIHGIRRPKPTV